jgi:hypothetical protein
MFGIHKCGPDIGPGDLCRNNSGVLAVLHHQRPTRASFHRWGNPALQFAPAGRQSGDLQNVSGRWIVIQREQKLKRSGRALKRCSLQSLSLSQRVS